MDTTAVSVQAENPILLKDKVQVPLPLLRFCNLSIALLFVDVVVSLSLWLTGGDSSYMEKHILHFNFKDSVFDLAMLSVVRAVVLVYLFTKLERITLATLNAPYEQSLLKRKKIYYRLPILITFLCFAYSVTKGIFVYLARNNDKLKMHKAYYALVISSAVFCFVEFGFSIASPYSMRKLLRYVVQRTKDEENKEKDRKVDLSRLIRLAKSEFGILAMATFALLISSGSLMAAPLFFGEVINAASESRHKGMGRLNTTILILFGVYAAGAVASFVRSWLYTLAGQRLVARVRRQVFNAICQQGIAFFDSNRTGELINRLSSDTQVIQNAVTVNISMLARYSLQIIGSLVIMFVLSPKLTAVLLSVVPVIGIGAQRYGQHLQNLRKIFQDKLASSSTTAEETFSSMRTVRSFSQETKAMNLYKKDIDQTYEVGKKISFATGLFNGIVGIISQGGICLVLWYGGKLVHDEELSIGILTAFMLYTLNVAMAFAFLSSVYGDFMQAVGASIRIFQLLDREPEIRITGGTILSSARLTLAFDCVSFAYPTRPDNQVIKNLSFAIEPGETVALVGPSGGGKSTVISLIERFYDPDSGQICLGDSSLASLNPEWYRKRIALVGQEPVLFGVTIGENIAYGRDASQEEIEEAARQANAHSFITSFEDGYATQVGERGVKLSGGQKQRVAIARALLMDPDILLLDEATSALDSESEHLVKEAIERAMLNRTVLVIAHRLSTVKNASKVIVIENGSIAEQGNHKELLSHDGVYRRLVYRQLSTTDDDPEEKLV